jgi:hypothetical protein
VMVPARRQVEVDFVADNPGPSLFHCHNAASYGLRLHDAGSVCR